MRHRDVRRFLYDFARGELDARQARRIEHHLAGCDRCYAEFQILKEGMRLVQPMKSRPSERRSDAYWHNVGLRIEHRIREAGARRPVRHRLWQEAEWFFLFRRPYAIALTTSTAIVVLAAILWFAKVRPELVEPAGRAMLETQAQTVNEELGDYFRKSKVLLVGISNLSVPEGQQVDLSVERRAARALIRQARYFEQQPIDARSQQLVKTLERILIELANMEDRVDLPDVEIVRGGIHQENMLFKIRMAEVDLNRSAHFVSSKRD